MKRIKYLFLCFLLCTVFVFASCGGNEESSSAAGSSTPESTEVVGNLKITLALNGGTLSSRVISGVSVGQDISSKLGKPSKLGYKFVGWYTDEALTTPFDGIVKEEIKTLYAKYDANKYAANVYNNSPSVADEVKNIDYGSVVVVDEPTRPNATFVGWYYDNGYVNEFNPKLAVTAELDLYARFKFNEGTTVYVSNTGKASNEGTKNSPLDIYTAVYFAGPGVTIVLENQTYELSKRVVLSVESSGSHSKYATIEGNGAILDFTTQGIADSNRGIQINGEYYHVKNLTVKKAGDNGMLVAGSNNIVECCVFTENADTGLQISRYDSLVQDTIDKWPSNNLILNCTSYNNCDVTGENADGFAAKLTCGNNIFDGCIAYCNSDDGYDLYAKSDTGPIGNITLRNCLAIRNGILLTDEITAQGDGNGFKLGGSNISGHVIMENCAAWYNETHGFTDNSNPGTIILKNCTSFDNGQKNGNNDNFNIARNAEKANNCFYGLVSYHTNADLKNGDDIRGSIANSILRFTYNNNTSYYKFNDYYEANSYYQTACGTETEALTSDIFESVQVLPIDENIHTAYRNEDGSINLGDFLKLKNADLLGEGNMGANLSLGSNAEYEALGYYYGQDLENVDPSDLASATLSQAYKNLFPSYIEEGVFKNFKIPAAGYKVAITWTSSNPNAIDVSGEIYKNTAVVNRTKEDQEVVLTATITYTKEDGTTVSCTKEFTYIVKALAPNIGSVTGMFDQTVYDYDNIIDESSYLIVKDLNDTTGKALVYGEDFEISTTYYKGDEVVETIDSYGKYTVEMVISLIGYDVTSVCSYTVNYLSDSDNASITEFVANYIIGGKAIISGSVDCKDATLFVVAMPTGTKLNFTAANIKAIAALNVEGQIAAEKVELTDTEFALDLNVGDVASCEVYAVLVRNDWIETGVTLTTLKVQNKSRASSLEVASMISISTVEEFHTMATVQDAAPKAYALTADLDFTGYNWTLSDENNYYFAGYLEGNGHTISNLNITANSLPGIFSNIKGGIVKNLNIENCSATQATKAQTKGVGILAAYANGSTIENVHVKNVNVTGYEGVGGLIGTINSGVNNISLCSVTNDAQSVILCENRYVGGLIGGILDDKGASVTTITNVMVSANVTCTGTICGGIVGRFKNEKMGGSLTITNGVYYGSVNSTKYSGGAIGSLDKAGTKAYLNNVVAIVEIVTPHTESRSILGSANSDDYTVSNNIISVGTFTMGQDNAENNFVSISNPEYFWFSIAGLDSEIWEVVGTSFLPSFK